MEAILGEAIIGKNVVRFSHDCIREGDVSGRRLPTNIFRKQRLRSRVYEGIGLRVVGVRGLFFELGRRDDHVLVWRCWIFTSMIQLSINAENS